MKRNFDWTANPGGAICGSQWSNEQVFERDGDDNRNYFFNEADQLSMRGGPAPWDYPFHDLGTGSNNTKSECPEQASLQSVSGQTVTTFLCQESQNTMRTILLYPRSAAHIYIDAWEPWQTTPISVQAFTIGASGGQRAGYSWSLNNYVPIGSSVTSGSGKAEFCSQVPHDTEGPTILNTLGSTARSPLGEYPVSAETRAKSCYASNERPFFLFQNQSHSAVIKLIVKVDQN